MASLFDAIVMQNLTVLSRGPFAATARGAGWRAARLHPGGCAKRGQLHIPERWQERGVARPEGVAIDELVFAPPMAEYFGAFGAVEFARREREATTSYLGSTRLAEAVSRGSRGLTPRGRRRRHVGNGPGRVSAGSTQRPAWQPPAIDAGTVINGFIGLDAGSTSTKAVLLDEAGRVVAKAYQLSRGNPIEDAIEIFASLRQQIESQGAQARVHGLVTTGYAKDILKDVFAGRRGPCRNGGTRAVGPAHLRGPARHRWTSAGRTSRSS